MARKFNVTGACNPKRHYMVDLTSRLEEIRAMVEEGDYFTINRGRQYGKTTILRALAVYLENDYEVVSLDFQRLGSMAYENEPSFVSAFSRIVLTCGKNFPEDIREKFTVLRDQTAGVCSLQVLFDVLTQWCGEEERPVVLLIDEVDTATNNQIFLDFLAQLRADYLDRDIKPTFQSVILAGVHDVRNIKRKIRADEEHKVNSPWNIAADFPVKMNFQAKDIAGMLREYEQDHETGMDIDAVSKIIYDYTNGYPVLVSRICKLLDERVSGAEDFSTLSDAWTEKGVIHAVGMLLIEKNALFESLIEKVDAYPELRSILSDILMNGAEISYNPDLASIQLAEMYGFIRREGTKVVIANRIFETRLYNYFLSAEKERKSEMSRLGEREKYRFVKNGELNMKAILERFVVSFDDLYGDRDERFIEDDGRRYFLLYLRPIINGVGNYYIEPRTRNNERTDIVIDYMGKQIVCELKIWRGNAYNERGEQQITDYLDYYHLDTGYMLSFCFNKNKKIGVHEVTVGEKTLVEAVV